MTGMKINVNKLMEENKHLREQHMQDMKALANLKVMLHQGMDELTQATDMILAEVVIKCGEPVVDDGEVIGVRLDIPAPAPHNCRVITEPYDKYVGLDKNRMYRLGIVYTEN